MDIIKGGITVAKGFTAAGGYCGVKRKNKDIALIYSDQPAKVAASFTTNVVKAAPVLWNKKIVDSKETVQGIVINSGNANACTGELGVIHTEKMAETTGTALGIGKEDVIVASTGVIGVQLPIDKICNGINDISKKMDNNLESSKNASEAIMTTDTFIKEIAVEIIIDGKKVRIGGMAKGSGMIHPNMATMLSFITTDINISSELLRKALKESVGDSYNMISVDGDTSTNDMVVVLANGQCGNQLIDTEDENYRTFKKALDYVNVYLAKLIIKDGEGITKFIEVNVNGAKSKEDAKKVAKSVITSNLVKTAFFGEDANWGRVLCAMGYSGVEFDPLKVSLKYISNKGEVLLLENGVPTKFDEDSAFSILQEKEIFVEIEMKSGDGTATAWGCDLSYEYVRINGEYRT